MHVTTANRFNPAVFRSAPPPPPAQDDHPVLDSFCRAGDAVVTGLPGAVVGAGVGLGMTFWPALALGGRVGACLAAGAALVGACAGGYVTASLAGMD